MTNERDDTPGISGIDELDELDELRAELIAMAEEDLRVRSELEDEGVLDERRARLGLPSMAELERANAEHAAETAHSPFSPEEWARREREREAWLRKVGWR